MFMALPIALPMIVWGRCTDHENPSRPADHESAQPAGQLPITNQRQHQAEAGEHDEQVDRVLSELQKLRRAKDARRKMIDLAIDRLEPRVMADDIQRRDPAQAVEEWQVAWGR